MKGDELNSRKPVNKCAIIIWMILSVSAFTPGCVANLEAGRALLKEISTSVTRKLIPIAQEIIFDVDVSPQCTGSLLKFMTALKRNEPWALKSE